MRTVRSPRCGRRRAMTLVELLIALALTALVGLAASMLMTAGAAGARHQRALQSTVVRAATLRARIDAHVRAAVEVLHCDDTALVLWLDDAERGDEPRLSELIRIVFDDDTGEVTAWRAPAGLADASNPTYNRSNTNFNAVTAALAGSASFPAERWAAGISAVALSTESAGRCVAYRFRVSVDDIEQPIIGAAALRGEP